MPRKRKRYIYRTKYAPNFGGWQPEEVHEHEYEQVTIPAANRKKFIVDKCTSCGFETPRDLI